MWRATYDRIVAAAASPRAPQWLAALAFTEACVFPIPPDVLLVPMALARPARGWRFALITTLASTAGGVLGYILGVFFIDAVTPWLQELGYMASFHQASAWFVDYGFWAVLLAGFSPVPYKIFTVAAGAVGMAAAPFIAACIVGRGLRFYLITGLVLWLGPAFEERALKYINWIGWLCVAAVVVALVVWQLR